MPSIVAAPSIGSRKVSTAPGFLMSRMIEHLPQLHSPEGRELPQPGAARSTAITSAQVDPYSLPMLMLEADGVACTLEDHGSTTNRRHNRKGGFGGDPPAGRPGVSADALSPASRPTVSPTPWPIAVARSPCLNGRRRPPGDRLRRDIAQRMIETLKCVFQ